jgi:hypothetical protein
MALRSRCPVAFALAGALLVAPAAAPASGGGDGDRREARVSGRCSRGAKSELRLRSRDGTISVRFDVERRRARERWVVVLVHERRVASRTTLRTRSSGSFRIERSLDDLDGPDQVTVRGSGPRGITCEASATLAG